MEGFYVEINLRLNKWLLCYSYNRSRNNIDFHREHLNRILALYSSHYDNFIIIDFNAATNITVLCQFLVIIMT